MVKYNIMLFSFFLLAFSGNKKSFRYYLLITCESKYDALSNEIDNEVSYFGLIPKLQDKDNFSTIVSHLVERKIDINKLKKRFKLINISFPIHKDNNFLQIDSLKYKYFDFKIDSDILKRKANMLYNNLYASLLNYNYCNSTNQNAYWLAELKGSIHYLTGEILAEHIRYNELALMEIKNQNSGNIVFKDKIYNSEGRLETAENRSVKCKVNFNNLKHIKTFGLDFNNKVIKDTAFRSPVVRNVRQ